MVFTAPKIVEGEYGWGPPNEVDKVKALTYAPFTKSDKFGRAADWNQSGYSKYGGCECSCKAPSSFFAQSLAPLSTNAALVRSL